MDSSAWSAAAHWYHPDIVYQIHCDYIHAGARVITTNSFHGAKHILETIGLGEAADQINRRAVEIAKQAREDVGVSDVLIAGSLSTIPSLIEPTDVPRGRQVRDNYSRQADILAQAGVDLLLCEMLIDSTAGVGLIACAKSTGLPVWAGVSASKPDDNQLMAFRTPGKYLAMPDESFDHLVGQVATSDISLMGVMHTKPALMPAALKILRRHWSGPAMAYAETGHFRDNRWCFDDAIKPRNYAQQMATWTNEFDLHVIGGCCGTSIEHIKSLSQQIRNEAMQSHC
jgi:S-methylmethionine-dependent homocysteine/selenocysteine methylase